MKLFQDVAAPSECRTIDASEQPAPLFRNTAGHHISPTVEFGYTFGDDQLREAVEKDAASVLVHHGEVPPVDGYRVVHVHHEALSLFVGKDAGISNISLADLALVLDGKIANWKLVGGNNVPITLGFRADGIFFETARFLLGHTGSGMMANAFRANSYQDLAAYGAGSAGSLLVGLRGPSARSPRLMELRLDGHQLARSTNRLYPLCGQVTLLLRRNDPKARVLGRKFADGFAQRVREDGFEEQGRSLIRRLEQSVSFDLMAEAQ
jgi:hypothetical protein